MFLFNLVGGEEYNVDVKTMITPILYHYTERQSSPMVVALITPILYLFLFNLVGGEEYNVDVKTMITPILYHYTERQSSPMVVALTLFVSV